MYGLCLEKENYYNIIYKDANFSLQFKYATKRRAN